MDPFTEGAVMFGKELAYVQVVKQGVRGAWKMNNCNSHTHTK